MDSDFWMVLPFVGIVLVVNGVTAAVTRCRLQRLERRVSQIENMTVTGATAPPMPMPPIQTVYYPPLQQPQPHVYRPVVATAPPASAFMSI